MKFIKAITLCNIHIKCKIQFCLQTCNGLSSMIDSFVSKKNHFEILLLQIVSQYEKDYFQLQNQINANTSIYLRDNSYMRSHFTRSDRFSFQ